MGDEEDFEWNKIYKEEEGPSMFNRLLGLSIWIGGIIASFYFFRWALNHIPNPICGADLFYGVPPWV